MSAEADKRAKAVEAALARIPSMIDEGSLRALMANARRMEASEVEEAAGRRLLEVRASAEPGDAAPGSPEHDVWQAIGAIEEMKSEAAGKTIRLSYLRRDIQKLGVLPAIDKLVSKPGQSERFDELRAAGRSDLTAEAVVLSHRSAFSDTAIARAEERLATIERET